MPKATQAGQTGRTGQTAPLVQPEQTVETTYGPPPRSMSYWIRAYAQWVGEGRCWIKDKHGNLVQMRLNRVQLSLLATMLNQADERSRTWRRGRPIRVIVLKARKHGVSTLIETFLYFITRYLNHFTALTVAHSGEGRAAVFTIVGRCHAALEGLEKPPRSRVEWPGRDSRFISHTARGYFVGTADTLQALHISELAKCQSEAGLDAQAVTSMVNAVPQANPFSIVVIESTGQGPAGEFYDRCRLARDPESGSDYVFCFYPWFYDPEYSLPAPDGFQPDDYGQWLLKTFKLSLDQVYWYDWMLNTEHKGDRALMRWEYPSTPEEAFEMPEGRVYPSFSREKNVRKIESLAGATLYRAFDWGDTEAHKFAAVWLAHWPDRDPLLTVDPDCDDILDEFQLYRWSTKSDDPVKDHDDCLDALRYGVTSGKLTGHVHVYRTWSTEDGASYGDDGKAKKVHELSGWGCPDGGDPRDLGSYRPLLQGTRERYAANFGDVARPGAIKAFSRAGIETTGYKSPSGGPVRLGKGPVRDGIAWVAWLIRGESAWESSPSDEEAETYAGVAEMRAKWNNRPVLLPRTMQQKLHRLEERDRNLAGQGSDLD